MHGLQDLDRHSPEAWYRSLPPLTRTILTLSFIVTFVTTFSLLSPRALILDWRDVAARGHVWKLATDYLFSGQFSFGWLMHIYFWVTFSKKLELNNLFTASPGAYLYFLVFQCSSLDILSLILSWPSGRPLLGSALTMSIIYYWSRREPFETINLLGFQVQAYQFPFALLFLNLLMGHSLITSIMGLATGHLYYLLKDVLPQEKGLDILKSTPKLCDEIMIRCGLFDIQNLHDSFKILLLGRRNVTTTTSSRPSAPSATGFTGRPRRVID